MRGTRIDYARVDPAPSDRHTEIRFQPIRTDRLKAAPEASASTSDQDLAQQPRSGRVAGETNRMELAGNGHDAGGQEPSTSAAVAVQPTAFGRDMRPRLIKLDKVLCARHLNIIRVYVSVLISGRRKTGLSQK